MGSLFEGTRDFTYLSDVYVYIEQFGKKGHQIGRKIGDMLELLTMGYCYSFQGIKRCMKTELALEGFTEARHKVEFSFFKLDDNNELILDETKKVEQKNLIGFIECKKVGVEVTVHSRTRNKDLMIRSGEAYEHKVNPHWLHREIRFNIGCQEIKGGKAKISIDSVNYGATSDSKQSDNIINDKFVLNEGDRFLITLVEDGNLRIIKPTEKLADLSENVRLCHVFTVRRINEGVFFKIETCLTGPQTIEKAKQAGLVALDVRKKILGKWGKEEKSEDDNLTSILVIGEVSHWEKKSRKVVTKTIDYNLVVPDNIIIRAFQKFHKEFGEDFLRYINKNKLKKSTVVQRLINEVIIENKERIFYDLEDSKYKKIEVKDNKLLVLDL